MKISIIQLNSILGNKEENYKNAISKIEETISYKPDVIVLPELFDTGFFPENNLLDISDNNGQKVIDVFSNISKTYNTNIIAGSILNNKNGNIFNTSYVFDRSGNNIASYDKVHLFSPMEEKKFFNAGNKITNFELDNIKAGIIICYDLRFPELSRLLALKGMDILFVVSQWPETRISQLHLLLRARAVENQCYVVCANGCGVNGDVKFGGESIVFSPIGDVLAKGPENQEIITCDIDFSIIKEIRQNINIFNDRREDLYNLKTII